METNEGELLRKYLRDEKITQEEFATKLGLTRQGLGVHMRKGELSHSFKLHLKDLGVTIFDNRKESFTNVNEPTIKYGNAKEVTASNIMEVPLVDQFAYAGYMSGYKDEEYIENLPTVPFIVDKQYKGNYRCFQIRGDSMDDGTDRSYKDGSIALGRELGRQHWQSKFRINRYRFIIVHRTEGILIKEIIKHDVEKGILTLHSYNNMYEDLTVKLDDVLQLFNVIKVVRDE